MVYLLYAKPESDKITTFDLTDRYTVGRDLEPILNTDLIVSALDPETAAKLTNLLEMQIPAINTQNEFNSCDDALISIDDHLDLGDKVIVVDYEYERAQLYQGTYYNDEPWI